MSRKTSVVLALVMLAAGGAALAWAAATAGAVDRPARPPSRHLADAYPRAATAAYGRRVLVLQKDPLEPVRGTVFESARAPGGWELYAVAPSGADAFAASMQGVADRTAKDWEQNRRLTEASIRDLARSGVAIVVVADDRSILSPEDAVTAGLSSEPSIPALRVRGAEPVMRVVDGKGGTPDLDIAIRTLDFTDGMWGGSVTVEVAEPGAYVFAWPAEGARVTVDGAPVTATPFRPDLPLVRLDLPAGNVAVSVEFGATGRRGWASIIGALLVTLALVWLLLVLRPHPDRDDEAAGPDEDARAELGAGTDGPAG